MSVVFPGAVRAEQPEERAVRYLQVEAGHRGEADLVRLAQALDPQRGRTPAAS
ncbi:MULTISPECIES: hypothetical protein [unclassified Streptomyces]|uniref:hypothetical protein n=1 Tax=unclassified Streptomyces TaxID=2593676 RepID=UPI001C84D193|nr:hypothetical protein [Streptomyces sp. PanSC9]